MEPTDDMRKHFEPDGSPIRLLLCDCGGFPHGKHCAAVESGAVGMIALDEMAAKSNEDLRAEHAAMAAHNADVPGMPNGPCQCPICKP
jgi:hypothetical protein